jgi:hypothetical protein
MQVEIQTYLLVDKVLTSLRGVVGQHPLAQFTDLNRTRPDNLNDHLKRISIQEPVCQIANIL